MAHSIPVSKTKIVVPQRRAELLSRARLLESFGAALTHKLTLICAPAGYGKTSLLVDFVHGTDIPVCWLSLDLLDRDPQRFMAYMIAALAEKFPEPIAPLQSMLSELKSIERDSESVLVELTNELREQVKQDFIFILDDYHLLEDVPVITSLLDRFLQLLSENCHVVISSRTPPSLPDLTLMIGRGQVKVLGQAELAFRPREVQSFLAQSQHRYLSDQSVEQLVEQTGGWITGIILTNQTGSSEITDADTFTYLSRQVLDQQPEPLRLFLLRTSLAEEFNAELCEDMLADLYDEPQDWAGMMDQLLKRNLFVLPLGGARERWLQYHPLFRAFLQVRLKDERPQEVKPILERLVRVYEQHEDWEKAYYTCQQLGDPDALAAVVEMGGSPMLRRSFSTLDGWLNRLPQESLRKRPGLISLSGAIANNKGNFTEAIALLDEIQAFYRKEKDVAGLSVALVRRAYGLRMLGEYERSLNDIDEVIRLTKLRKDLQETFADALRIKGQNLHRLGKTRQASDCLEQSLALCITLNASDSIPMLLDETATVHQILGNVKVARFRREEALSIWSARKNIYALAGMMNNLGVMYHQIGDYEASLKAFENGLIYAHRTQHRRVEALILLGLGDLYAEVEAYVSANEAYQKVDMNNRDFRGAFVHIYLILARVNLAILQGSAAEALQILNAGENMLRASQSLYEQGMYALLLGKICLLEGSAEKAITFLKESRDYFVEGECSIEILWARLWLALAQYQNNERELAREELKGILTNSNQVDHYVVAVVRQARSWLFGLQSDPEVGSIIRSLFERVGRFERELPGIRRQLRRLAHTIEIPPPRMAIRAFGNAQVYVDGRPITIANWQTQSVRELFFYFLMAKRPLTKEKIGETLWSEETEPERLKLRFKNEIYRLRRAVGRDAILFDQETYQFNSALDYEYDVEAFDVHFAKAKFAKTASEQIDYYEKAIDLVQGPYLENVGATWAWPERERLSQTFLSALLTLAGLRREEGNLLKALDVCGRALKFDPAFEATYCLMMRIYHHTGDRLAIIHTYETCKKNLRMFLDLSPSEETQKLYRDLAS